MSCAVSISVGFKVNTVSKTGCTSGLYLPSNCGSGNYLNDICANGEYKSNCSSGNWAGVKEKCRKDSCQTSCTCKESRKPIRKTICYVC